MFIPPLAPAPPTQKPPQIPTLSNFGCRPPQPPFHPHSVVDASAFQIFVSSWEFNLLRLLCRILAEKEKEEEKLRKMLQAAIASGDKNALMKAIKEAKMAGLSDAGLRFN